MAGCGIAGEIETIGTGVVIGEFQACQKMFIEGIFGKDIPFVTVLITARIQKEAVVGFSCLSIRQFTGRRTK